MARFILVFFACLLAGYAQAAEIRIATFNTESDDDTQPIKVAETIGKLPNVDIWALQEVEDEEALQTYRLAAKGISGEPWRSVISESGINNDRQSDRLGLLYRTDIFRQLETIEYHAVRSRHENNNKYGRPDWGMRAALFLRLMHIPSKREFYVGTVHLKCCGEGEDQRLHQAALLAQWIKRRDVPVILLGDTNIPIEPGLKAPQVTAAAFKKLTTDAGMVWVEPNNPVKTQCDNEFNSMLDQVYHTTNLQPASVTAEIQFTSQSYCDADRRGYSDHRPVVATFSFPD